MLEGVIPLETFPLCGVALRRTYRCTEFHRVKNANLRHPFRNVLRRPGPTKGCRANDDNDDTDVSKGHSRVCTGVLKCLIFLKEKKKQVTILSDVRYECFVGAKRLLRPTVRAIIPFHCRIQLFIRLAVNLLSLKWKPLRDKSLSTVYRQN